MDLPKAPRPCSFVAPPPPDTPPPPDSIPVSYDEVVGQKADTVDIGVGEDTTSFLSQKSSPTSSEYSHILFAIINVSRKLTQKCQTKSQ